MLEGKLTLKNAVFVALFLAAGVVAARINFSQLLGSPNQFFTLFQFFAPIAGAFLGSVVGPAVVLATQAVDFLFFGKEATLLNVGRVLPLAFAAWYFAGGANARKVAGVPLTALVPFAAIVLFLLHPVGGQAWFFPAVFWTIPVAVALFAGGNLLARSLGATLTAHAVGGVVWIYSLPTTPAFWAGLVPIVAYERLLFAAGIAVSYVAFNAVLSRLPVSGIVKVNRQLPFAAAA